MKIRPTLCVPTLFPKSPSYYADLYRKNNVTRCHVIKLGPNNNSAAKEALQTWPQGLQVIITSYLFPEAKFSLERLKAICQKVGKNNLVVDVSCRRSENQWVVAMNKWQTMTDMVVNKESLDMLSEYCSEFLVHAANVEGLCNGIDEELVECLGKWVSIPTTYAGGGRCK
ncbi:unnamed protein product [Absidia cylindrospora]